MDCKFTRRDFVRATTIGASCMAAAAGMPSLSNAKELPPLVKKREIPMGDLCGLKVSKMLLGGNLLTFAAHSRDLSYVGKLAQHYNTPEKIIETLWIAEEHGINTCVIHTAPGVLDGMKEYKRRGGSIQWILCPIARPDPDMVEMTEVCQRCIDAGAVSLYWWGVHSDVLYPNADLVRLVMRTMKSFDVPVGIAAHRLEVIEACEKEGIPCDYYVKTFHHHKYPSANLNFDSSWCADPEKTIEVMAKVEKPWISFKIMAAGAIKPRDALEYAFKNGADFTIFGMFDFEVDEDTRLMNEVYALDDVQNRPRKWYG